MGAQNWIVKNGGGDDWGLIRRLVIDAETRQISFADVFVVNLGHITRIPWDSFEIRHEGITLRMPEAEAVANGIESLDERSEEAVSMDVWP